MANKKEVPQKRTVNKVTAKPGGEARTPAAAKQGSSIIQAAGTEQVKTSSKAKQGAAAKPTVRTGTNAAAKPAVKTGQDAAVRPASGVKSAAGTKTAAAAKTASGTKSAAKPAAKSAHGTGAKTVSKPAQDAGVKSNAAAKTDAGKKPDSGAKTTAAKKDVKPSKQSASAAKAAVQSKPEENTADEFTYYDDFSDVGGSFGESAAKDSGTDGYDADDGAKDYSAAKEPDAEDSDPVSQYESTVTDSRASANDIEREAPKTAEESKDAKNTKDTKDIKPAKAAAAKETKGSAGGSTTKEGKGGAKKTDARSHESHRGSHHRGKDDKIKLPKIRKSKRMGFNASLIFLMLFFVLICVVLPRLSMFSHVIDVSENEESVGEGYFLRMGDEGYDVAHLQRELYKQGYIEFDSINSRFDDTTLNALNRFLTEHDMPIGTECSYNAFQAVIMGAEEKEGSDKDAEAKEDTQPSEQPAETDAAEPSEPAGTTDGSAAVTETTAASSAEASSATTTTAASTTTTTAATTNAADTEATSTTAADQGGKTVKVRILRSGTYLYAEPDVNSTRYYIMHSTEKTYRLVDTHTDAEGKIWYKIRYFVNLDGWVEGDKSELIQ